MLVLVSQLARQRMLRQMPESSRGFLGDVDPGEEVGADGDRPMSRACIVGHSRSMVGRVLQASGVVLGNRLSELGILTRFALILARAMLIRRADCLASCTLSESRLKTYPAMLCPCGQLLSHAVSESAYSVFGAWRHLANMQREGSLLKMRVEPCRSAPPRR